MTNPLAAATAFGTDTYEKIWESVSGGNLLAGGRAFSVERSLGVDMESLASRDGS